ncbi:hypothetical protein AYO21_04847 [Fonsecaea monophora]|uniref:Uncharacterized protein n=1 Tax=Fonsecaea monophora TaxID=254056 RepID=A0A177F9S8_9EURO|nr:hypothetical protein AYO21_04847 [Fonsecaea monophora]OAG41005.1 hypothetical protein AYO21_04847 [Fonsecaea monophora]
MDKDELSGGRQSPRKRETANNENNADEQQSPALGSRGESIFVGIQDYRTTPVYFNMVGQFGGPCFDTSTNFWKKSLQVEVDGSIEAFGTRDYAQVQYLAQDPQQVQAAVDYVGQLAKYATGRLFITVLRNPSHRNGQLEAVDGVAMSGFWLDRTKFVTCAHFLKTVEDTNADETERSLRDANPQTPRAFVSNRKNASPGVSTSDSHSWPVHLLRLSRTSDIAIFELNQGTAKGESHPPHSIRLSDLSALLTAPSAGNGSITSFEQINPSSLPLFAAYYPGDDDFVENSDVSPVRKQFAREAGILSTWGLFCEEARLLNPAEAGRPPSFNSTFAAHNRSVAFGRIETPQNAALWEPMAVREVWCASSSTMQVAGDLSSWDSIMGKAGTIGDTTKSSLLPQHSSTPCELGPFWSTDEA